jgi:acetyltransferase-like isoleucine patch superfamily enzyme
MAYLTADELKLVGFKLLGKNVKVSRTARIMTPHLIEIGDNAQLHDFCELNGKIKIGRDSVIQRFTKIIGINGPSHNIIFGDSVLIGEHVQIIIDELEIKDYSKVHHHVNIHGYLPCSIGNNAWIGQYSIIDSVGGAIIGDNCGIGAHSQLWSHIKYGDTLEGCRFLSQTELSIGDDVWLVGHCIVSPVRIENKAMALVGSVIIKNMEYNTIYGGSPAKPISSRVGYQFDPISVEEKYSKLTQYLENWSGDKQKIKIITDMIEINLTNDVSYFNVNDRKYTKKYTNAEVSFIKYLLPDKAKFIPY